MAELASRDVLTGLFCGWFLGTACGALALEWATGGRGLWRL